MFSVTYELKPHGAIVYTVNASDVTDARRQADRHFAIECAGYKVRKVIVKESRS